MHTPQLPSEKKFGLFFAAIFVLVAIFLMWRLPHSWLGSAPAWGLIALGGGFALAAFAAPAWLAPLNRLWFRLGMLLGRIVSPIVLGLIYFGILTPVAIIGRLAGRDELRMRRRNVASHWIERDPKGPAPESYRNQF